MRATQILRRKMLPFLSDVHAKRVRTTFEATAGLVRRGRLSCTAIGRALVGKVSPKHNIKKVDRLLSNGSLFAERAKFFRGLSALVLEGEANPVVLVDWTKLCGGFHAIVAAVPADGRALPIYVEVHEEALLGNGDVEAAFLKSLSAILPTNCTPTVVTDAGFRNPWFQAVARLGWNYVGRMTSYVHIGDDCAWTRVSDLYSSAGSTPTDLGVKSVAKVRNTMSSRLVLMKKQSKGRTGKRRRKKGTDRKCRQRALNPWLLTTSLHHASVEHIIALYATRMQIEESFRDTKNHRFGWSFEDARCGSQKRLTVLLLIGALGMLAVTLIGRAAEKLGLARRYQANTVSNKRVLSHYYLGALLIARRDLRFLTWTALKTTLHELRQTIAAHSKLEVTV